MQQLHRTMNLSTSCNDVIATHSVMDIAQSNHM